MRILTKKYTVLKEKWWKIYTTQIATTRPLIQLYEYWPNRLQGKKVLLDLNKFTT